MTYKVISTLKDKRADTYVEPGQPVPDWILADEAELSRLIDGNYIREVSAAEAKRAAGDGEGDDPGEGEGKRKAAKR
jgi:hypothetical protein